MRFECSLNAVEIALLPQVTLIGGMTHFAVYLENLREGKRSSDPFVRRQKLRE